MKDDSKKLKYSADAKHFKTYMPSSTVKAMDVTRSFINQDSLNSDPYGSWTGKPENRGEKPVQDVDDL